ncbi:hypothetical protein GCM10010198_53360 [Nocardia seriolae]|nr:hypothetical protein NSERUTF1_3689 [Nocardia seriolae]BEK88569.1 hypothetical protein NSERKGN1266_45200 [Nocardia seriolae]
MPCNIARSGAADPATGAPLSGGAPPNSTPGAITGATITGGAIPPIGARPG